MAETDIKSMSHEERFEAESADVKAFRVQADALMEKSKELAAKWGGSRAYSLMFTHAELSKMYGGKRLEELGSPFPAKLADKSTPGGK